MFVVDTDKFVCWKNRIESLGLKLKDGAENTGENFCMAALRGCVGEKTIVSVRFEDAGEKK